MPRVQPVPLRSLLAGALALILFGAALPLAAEETLENLEIVTADGPHKFAVEVMRTPEQLSRGLMFRRYMPEDRGMLFDFKTEHPVQFWMKNTYLPLDMIFISKAGRSCRLRRIPSPYRRSLSPPARPVIAVLEVNAGTAARIHADPGDTLHGSIFGK